MGDVCSSGSCTVSCQAGLTSCGSSCVNTNTDPNNCGTCGHVCALANATSACSGAACVVTGCTAGFANCNGVASDGCEVNLATNANNCGTCGNACGSPPNTTGAGCSAGKCGFTCQAGYYNQNGQYGDGCECTTNGYSEATSCGAAAAVNVPAGPAVQVKGRLLGVASNWYKVTFPSENGKGGLHYQIILSNNGNPVVMTVFQNCTNTSVTCAATEGMSGYTSWDWSNNGTTAMSQYTQTYPVTYYVQVTPTGSASTCMDYTITAFVE
jgi:hypothetical protein